MSAYVISEVDVGDAAGFGVAFLVRNQSPKNLFFLLPR
jgi:hypothetical protein